MSPELERFFASMGRYFADSSAIDALYGEHPSWSAPRSRTAIYGEFVDLHVRDVLEKLYPLCRSVLTDCAWSGLIRAYAAGRPARHFEMNRAGEAFPTFLADRAGPEALPPFLPALARFEWADWSVYASQVEQPRVDRLAVNPTLVVLEHPWKLCGWVGAAPRPTAPEPGDELALLWRHPESLKTMFLAADARALLGLKIAVERLSPEDVSTGSGMGRDELEAVTQSLVRDGILLLPS